MNQTDKNIEQPAAADVTKIPVVEETVTVGKTLVETGQVRIRKHVETEDVTVEVPVWHDETEVQRVPVGQYVDAAPTVRQDGDTLVIPVVREEVVTITRLMLVEEIRVTRRQVQQVDRQTIPLRSERVTVDRQPTDPTNLQP